MTDQHTDVSRAYDDVAGSYDGHHVDAKSIAENRYVARFLSKRVRPGMKVVDMGCGTGLLLELCRVAEKDYLGFDISSGMLERARQKYPGYRFTRGDMQARNEEVADGSVDVVVSLFGSVSYCEISRVQAEVNRMLKDGGRYFLMFCSPLYVRRETYITRSTNLLIPYTRREIAAAFRPDALWGMSRFVDRLPRNTPVGLMDAILTFEAATVGRVHQDGCYFINAWGRKRGSR